MKGKISNYREFAVGEALSREVVCLWEQVIAPGGQVYQQRVLPDGCVDVVFIGFAEPIVVGTNHQAFLTNLVPGSTTVGIRFKPGMVSNFLGVPADELTDREIPLSGLLGNRARELWNRVLAVPTAEQKRIQLKDFFQPRCLYSSKLNRIEFAVKWLADNPSNKIAELCRLLKISPRQIHREFLMKVGLSPKTFQRILRFQRLLWMGRQCSRQSLADLSLGAGYADQAHMNREFKELSGLVPSSLVSQVESPLAMSDLFKKNIF